MSAQMLALMLFTNISFHYITHDDNVGREFFCSFKMLRFGHTPVCFKQRLVMELLNFIKQLALPWDVTSGKDLTL